jgi:hypothetical protein
MSEVHEMSSEGMSHTVVQTNFPEAGFGVSEIYERVPNEDEDFGEHEMCVGHRTDDVFEGEETCEDSREEDSDETVITSNTFIVVCASVTYVVISYIRGDCTLSISGWRTLTVPL